MDVVASLSQGRTAAVQCGLFTHKSVLVIFEPPCTPNLLSTKQFSGKTPTIKQSTASQKVKKLKQPPHIMVSITSVTEKTEYIFLKNLLKVAVFWNATSSTLPAV